MKKIFCVISVCFFALSVHAQDDRYYDNNNTDDVYGNDGYNEQQQDNGGTSYQAFYDQLDPYGSWINTPQYGYVWVPLQAGAGFSPYMTNGHWVYTDYGWTWVSDFEWGWATFHYGRWYQDPGYGWMWMPGYDWAPAWVVWGEYNNYYCWAPCGPGEYASTHYGGRDHHWYFVEHGYINDRNISTHVVSNTVVNHDGGNIEQHINVISHVNSYNRSVFYSGPKEKDVVKAIGHPIEHVSIAPATKAGATRVSGSQVSVYRPDIRRAAQQNAAPTHIGRTEDLPRNNNAPAANQPQRTAPQRENNTMPERQNPAPQNWSPPRQSVPRQDIPQSQPREQQPSPQRGGGFVPSERPSYQAPQQRQFSSPPPMHQSAPAPMHIDGGGRHF